MKSILFFLAVFSSIMVALYLIQEGSPKMPEDAAYELPSEVDYGEGDANVIDLPKGFRVPIIRP